MATFEHCDQTLRSFMVLSNKRFFFKESFSRGSHSIDSDFNLATSFPSNCRSCLLLINYLCWHTFQPQHPLNNLVYSVPRCVDPRYPLEGRSSAFFYREILLIQSDLIVKFQPSRFDGTIIASFIC